MRYLFWLLSRGYHISAKGMSSRRAKALSRQVLRWDAYETNAWLPKCHFSFDVKCKRCGEIIEGRVDLDNDLRVEYESDGNILCSQDCERRRQQSLLPANRNRVEF